MKKKQLILFCYHHGGDKTRFMTHLRPHTGCADHFSHAPKIGTGKQSACQCVHQVLQEEIGSFGLFALQSAIFFIAVLFLMVSINICRVISTFITQGAFPHDVAHCVPVWLFLNWRLPLCVWTLESGELQSCHRVDGQRWDDVTTPLLSLIDRNLLWLATESLLFNQSESNLRLSRARRKTFSGGEWMEWQPGLQRCRFQSIMWDEMNSYHTMRNCWSMVSYFTILVLLIEICHRVSCLSRHNIFWNYNKAFLQAKTFVVECLQESL